MKWTGGNKPLRSLSSNKSRKNNIIDRNRDSPNICGSKNKSNNSIFSSGDHNSNIQKSCPNSSDVFANNLFELQRSEYYFGPITSNEATYLLQYERPGTYLV